MKKKRHNLISIIKNDLFLNYKIHLILFIAIILSSLCVVMTVYQTRLLMIKEEKLFLIKQKQREQHSLLKKYT
ncbi:cell division protein FtsL [Buchnera aphidicola (Hyadaphis tataricae)]|uniref:Cell division protein FtsL n=1 Tax=Buchnera aphidicola (Hyadaphis tataricae) TaxID=1241859 RepID=A0A4D6XUK7_9GAMM|nr:cell division protein FtsL [Buchnera aphidicola]QCI21532.1 cell division protein FtsL [Buchnera aphidicola (Hyadaphis tataricae)]